MRGKFGQQIIREPPHITRRDIRIDVRELAHAGNNRADDRVAENETQRHLRQADSVVLGDWFEGVGAFDGGIQVVRHEVDVAPVALRPLDEPGCRRGESPRLPAPNG